MKFVFIFLILYLIHLNPEVMETKIDDLTEFVKINQVKFKTPMFIAMAIVFIAYFIFWGITDKGYFSGIITFVSIIKDKSLFIGYNGEMSISFYYYFLCLTLIPVSSGYLIYSYLANQTSFVKLAKILLLISFLPFVLQGIFTPIRSFGLFLSVVSVVYIFIPKIGDTVISRVSEFYKKLKNNQPH